MAGGFHLTTRAGGLTIVVLDTLTGGVGTDVALVLPPVYGATTAREGL